MRILIYIITINAITWAAYWLDKRAAIKGHARLPEQTLHVLALAGGTPAAWLAQQRLRHKTQKQLFQIVFKTILCMQGIAAVYWLYTNLQPS